MKFADGIEILGEITPAYSEILTPEAMTFLANWRGALKPRGQSACGARKKQAEIDAGALPDFPAETAEIRAKATGRSRRSPRTSRTAASRSPGRWTARWSSTR